MIATRTSLSALSFSFSAVFTKAAAISAPGLWYVPASIGVPSCHSRLIGSAFGPLLAFKCLSVLIPLSSVSRLKRERTELCQAVDPL
ncbi:MAG: hypothetical protein ACD_10C00837G0001 [uncultured bacterium]|nr:MAG: hypothetical protein ACD_10C00837G0001 [uncultured bacterium]